MLVEAIEKAVEAIQWGSESVRKETPLRRQRRNLFNMLYNILSFVYCLHHL